MNIALREAKFEDLLEVFEHARSSDRITLEKLTERLETAAATATMIDYNGRPIGVFGVTAPDDKGFSHVWAGFTDGARGHGIRVFRLARTIMLETMRRLGIRWLYTWNYADAPENEKWMLLLGFRREPEFDMLNEGQEMRGYLYGP